MAIVVSTAGQCELLDKTLKDALSVDEDFTLKLYQNDYHPLFNSVASDLVEANFTNYVAKTLTRSSWNPAVTVGKWSYSSYASQSWTCGATGNTIYGYYIIGATSGTLLWLSRFSGPKVLTNGLVLAFSPRLTISN